MQHQTCKVASEIHCHADCHAEGRWLADSEEDDIIETGVKFGALQRSHAALFWQRPKHVRRNKTTTQSCSNKELHGSSANFAHELGGLYLSGSSCGVNVLLHQV